MRIQHNIMAMGAYRNYTNNLSAMKKNLEKLSSGYKINRAGDDAAGLAISEKMRAQITGLNAAQKNAKDGISLVQTAEGALTEVHDMLNRMVQLATQSANGTYDNETDRAQMQKEIEQLKEEINRIADSSNFNGIKLLDGSMDGGGADVNVKGLDRMLAEGGKTVTDVGHLTILDGGIKQEAKQTEFEVDFTGVSASTGTTGGAKDPGTEETEAKVDIQNANAGTATTKATFDANMTYDPANVQTINIGGKVFQIHPAAGTANAAAGDASKVTFTGSGTEDNPFVTTRSDNWTDEDLTAAIAGKLSNGVTIGDKTFNVTADGTTLKFEAADVGTVQINGADATAETFKTAIEAAVKTSSGSNAGGDTPAPTPASPLGEVTASVGHAATTDSAAKLEVTVAYNGGAAPTWQNGDSVTFASDGDTALNLTATSDGTNWTVTGAPSGYTATFDGSKLTMTADNNGAKDLTTDSFGTVTISGTGGGNPISGATGTPTFTDGSTLAAAQAGTATATLDTTKLKAGDKLTIGGADLTITADHLTDASALATAIEALSSSDFTIEATGNSTTGAIDITLTEQTAGAKTEAELQGAIAYEAAAAESTGGAAAATAAFNSPAVMPAEGETQGTPGTAAQGVVSIAWDSDTEPTWEDNGTVTIAAVGDTDGNNAFSYTFKATDDGSGNISWALDTTASNTELDGFTAAFDPASGLTLTADDVGVKDLATADFGAITVSGTTDGSTAISAPSGTMAFTDGTNAVAPEDPTPEVPDQPGDDTPGATPAKADVAITWNNTPVWADNDTVTIQAAGKDGQNAFKYVFKYQSTATTAADGDATKWVLDTANSTPLAGYTPSFDGNNLTLTSTDGSKKNLTSADFGAVTVSATNAANNSLAGTGAVTFTDATGDEATGDITFTAKVGDLVLGEGIAVDNKATAKEIGAAVFEAIESDDTLVDEAEEGTKYVKINDATYSVKLDEASGKLKFKLMDDPTEDNIQGNFSWSITPETGKINGSHTGGTIVTTAGTVESASQTANTVFEIKDFDIKDGAKITLTDNAGASKTVTLAIGADSKASGDNKVVLTEDEAKDLDVVLSKISAAFGGKVGNLVVGVNNAADNGDDGVAHLTKGLTVQRDGGEGYTSMKDLGAVFSLTTKTEVNENKGLKLQIGDTADEYNQLKVSIRDMHADAMNIGDIDISSQDGAADAVDRIKAAINYVSDVRGTLGATQNRLDHTINNLSVMTENIQDAESTIRDTDVAEEMMAYTKNNILIQSAQAMLAQANQVPQGVLQLLG